MLAVSRAERGRGFTLIELMVAVAIAAILMLVAVPNFIEFQRSSELTNAANNLLSAMNVARGESLKRSNNTFVVPLTGADWASGFRVFVDVDRDETYSTGDTEIMTFPALPSYFSTSGNGNAAGPDPYVMFNGSGYAAQKNTLVAPAPGNLTISIFRNDLAGAVQLQQTRRLKVARTGRVRVCRPSTDVTCTATGI